LLLQTLFTWLFNLFDLKLSFDLNPWCWNASLHEHARLARSNSSLTLSILLSMASALLLLIFSIYWSQDLLCQLAGGFLVKNLSKSFLCCPDPRNLFWNRVA